MSSTTWTIDNSHTGVHFSVRHMMITTVRGEFGSVSGNVDWDPAHPENTKVEATVAASSINTREPNRDGHLKSPDFLDVEKYPNITFRSTALKRAGEAWTLAGDLTIRDVTRPVTLSLEAPSAASKDPFGNVRVGTTATTKIKRSDFGITWNAALEAGGVLVGDEISITLDISLIQKT